MDRYGVDEDEPVGDLRQSLSDFDCVVHKSTDNESPFTKNTLRLSMEHQIALEN
jgi:hypothetical protein